MIKKNIAFWGSSKESSIVLEKIYDRVNISAVITNPPRSYGRGRKLKPNIVEEKARKLGISSILTPEELDNNFYSVFKKFNFDLSVVVSYGKIIPEKFLNLPSYGSINLHFSLLPRWRGAAPVERSILAGEDVGGISIIKLVKELDAGPVYFKKELPFKYYYAYEIREWFSNIGGDALLDVIERIERLSPEPQTGKPSYAKKIKKEEGEINWSYSAKRIVRMIRAFTPWPSVYFFLDGKRVSIVYAEESHIEENLPAATIISFRKGDNGGVFVKAGEGTVFIKRIKPEGKGVVNAYDYLINGCHFKEGDSLT